MQFLAALKTAKGLSITIGIIAIISIMSWQSHRINKLQEDVDSANQTIGMLKGASASCGESLEGYKEQFAKQSSKIAELEQASEEQIKKLKEANDKVLTLERSKQKMLLRLSREDPGDSCEDIMGYLKSKSNADGVELAMVRTGISLK